MADLSRRALLGGALAGAGLSGVGLKGGFRSLAGPGPELASHGEDILPVHGAHQTGVTSPMLAHERFLAFNLKPETDREALERLFRILTADIESLTQGEGPIADTEPELAEVPARLTVTVGFGPGLVDRVSPNVRPEWLGELPHFSRDELDPTFNGGDLLLLIASDDPT